MADVLPSQLINSVMSKLYDVLTNGDDTVPASEDNFFSWCTPGIPVDAADFDFLTQGVTGVVRKAQADVVAAPGDPADAAPRPLPTAELERLRAQDAVRLYLQEENFARLVDFIPDVTKAENAGAARLSVLANEGTLSEVYARVLRMSQVAQADLPEETRAKIDKFRALLRTTVKKKDIIDDSEVETIEPSPLVTLYNQKQAAYLDATLEYNKARIEAMTGDNAQAVHFWSLNAAVLRRRVQSAMADWVSTGHKNDYERIAAFIDQVMQRDLTLLKQEYRDDLEKARKTGIVSGADYFPATLIPGNFVSSSGWTQFTFKSSDLQAHTMSTYTNKKWKVDANASWLGIFGGSGSAGSSSAQSEYSEKINTDEFSLSFEIAQVPIVRPWCHWSFLTSKTWRFDPSIPGKLGEMLSNGEAPPHGLMPAYPSAVVFIRKLKLSLGQNERFATFMKSHKSSQQDGGGYVRFGPFFGGGSGKNMSSNGTTQRDWGYRDDQQGMTVEGMQIAGFRCHVMPRSPDPLETIATWV